MDDHPSNTARFTRGARHVFLHGCVFVRAATGFVENFDTATVGSNAVATLVNTVTAMLAVDPELWTRLETWWPKLPVAVAGRSPRS